ncbi:MAG: hypothetical protein SWO11_00790 [Thermodesulfobacteriota bacterium]|nr:hypothetical protein [Thermodesulfobacteriota bacterium]
MVRYYGFYSNASRGKRKEKDQDGLIPSILEAHRSSKERRKNWVGLIQKIYQVDPLTCSKCWGRMKILSFIEDPEIIKKILKHLDLWDLKSKPLPRDNAPPLTTLNLTWTILTPSYLHPTITSMEMIIIQKGLLPNS